MTAGETIEDALGRLDGARGELIVDFSGVGRLNSGELRALEKLTQTAEKQAVKIVLSGVNVGVYRVLKAARVRCL